MINNGIIYSVFPNPASEVFYVNINTPSARQSLITMYDAVGNLLNEKQVQLSAGSNQLQWNISQLPKGIYFLKASGGLFTVIKILKQ
jgi:hypothetical protein